MAGPLSEKLPEWNEEDPVREWKRQRLIELGLSRPFARKLADEDVDVHAIVALVRAGCDVGTAARIVR